MAAKTTLEDDLNTQRCLAAFLLVLTGQSALAELNVVIIEGLGGEQRYTEQFDKQVTAIEQASRTLAGEKRLRVFRASEPTRVPVLAYLESLSSASSANDTLVIYLVGHGSYDDHEYKFNLPGPDLTDSDLATALDKLPNDRILLVNTSSSSGAIAESLQSDKRTLILATRSGSERHATRFGIYFASALSDESADIDKNEIITAKEAFDYATRGVSDFYERDGLLSTEHSRLEGDRADRFSLARLGEDRVDDGDSELRRLVAVRDAVNADVDNLRLSKDEMTPEDYQEQLLQKMLELARLEDAIEIRESEIRQDD
jgi:hypothetical protein